MIVHARRTVARFAAPLRIADVRRMWLSDVLSVLGDHAAILALAVLVYGRSHSPLAVALVSAAAFAPAFGVGPLLATLADRFAYRPVMVVADLVRAAAYLLILVPGLPLPVLVATVFLAHCASFPFSAARGAQLPQIAGDQYGAAQALSQATLQIGALLGFATGAAFLALVGARGALAADAVSFLLSAGLILRVAARARTVEDDTAPRASAVGRLRSGAATLRRDPLLFWPAALVTVAVLGATAADAMAVVVVHALNPHRSGTHGGLLALLLILPVSVTLIATVVCPTEGDPYRLVRISAWMAIGSHGLAIAGLLLLSSGRLGVLAVAVAYAGLGVSSAMTVPCVSVVGRRLPAANRASVFSLLEALLVGGQATGALAAGWATTHLGAGHGIAVLLAPAVLLAVVGIRRLQTPPALPTVVAGELVTAGA